jgi:hypothetical protein
MFLRCFMPEKEGQTFFGVDKLSTQPKYLGFLICPFSSAGERVKMVGRF